MLNIILYFLNLLNTFVGRERVADLSYFRYCSPLDSFYYFYNYLINFRPRIGKGKALIDKRWYFLLPMIFLASVASLKWINYIIFYSGGGNSILSVDL